MPYLTQQPAPPSYLQRIMNAPADACCTPAVALPALPASSPQRTRLADLDASLHCSIIGTCLTTAELRKLVPRHAPQLDRKKSTDLEIHHTAVELSIHGEAASKELHKAMDTRHALVVKRYKAAADDAALTVLWREALAHGDVPGAYWALLTHPQCSFDLRRQAFGDVHMLSHLVGASNRADLRRLSALEEESATLREQNATLQNRLQELSAQLHLATSTAQQQEQQLARLQARQACIDAAPVAGELAQLRGALATREEQLSLQIMRSTEAESQLDASRAAADFARREAEQHRSEAELAGAETQSLEQALMQTLERQDTALPQLNGRCVAYVGGRPQATIMLCKLVAAAGGELLVHDGGIEDRKGMLAALLPRAQMVVFPVDCISHNAMHVTRQLAERAGIPCHPLRNSSVASFIEMMQRIA